MTQSTQAFRLSPQQHRLWRLDPDGSAGLLHTHAVLELEGPVEVERLREALQRLVERHEVLRTSFPARAGFKVPFQVLDEGSVQVEWHATPLPSLTLDQLRAGGLHAHLEAQNSEHGTRHRLHLALPAPCLDAVGWVDLMRELASLYAAPNAAPNQEANEEPLQYADYAEWQLELLESEDEAAEAGRAYWRESDPAAVCDVRLPMQYADPREEGRRAVQRFEAVLTPELTSRVEALAQRAEAPVSMIWLSAWRWLLGRHARSGEARFEPAIAVRFDGRGFEELEGALGTFARWLPMPAGRSDSAAGALRAQDYVARVAATRRELDQQQPFFSWSEEQETLEPTIGFEFDPEPEPVKGGQVSWRLLDRELRGEPNRLKLSVFGRRLRVYFDPRFFARRDVERLAAEVVTLVSSMADAPEAKMSTLSYLPARDAEQVVESFNEKFVREARAGAEGESGILGKISSVAEREPDRIAVVFENSRLSYGMLDRLSVVLARRLRELGVGRDEPVALCLERSSYLLVAMLGILRAGGAYAALDPDQPARRLAAMLEDLALQSAETSGENAGGAVLVTDRTTPPSLQEYVREVVYLDQLAVAATQTAPASEPPALGWTESLAYVIFTSGSTGRPKGVAVSHGALDHYLRAVTEALDLPAGASYATVSTFGADLGHTSIFPALCTGGALHVVSRDRAADAAAFADYFERQAIDCLKIVPSHLQAVHESADGRRVLPHRRLVVGGEASERAWLQELAKQAGECRVFNHYGPSEATVGSLYQPVEPEVELDSRAATVPIGRPLPGSFVLLVDALNEPVPAWVAGEILIGGPGLARGYLGRPALTAQAFVPDAHSGASGARLYRTGDLARHLGDGSVEFLGRRDHQVKFHGFRIELEELREVLNRHDGVRNSVVRLLQDQQGHDVLVAYYVSRHELESADLRTTLAEEIPEETLPNVFVHLRKLPLNLNGKVNVEALPSLAQVRDRMEKTFVAPRNENESLLAEIWKEVLGVPRVGINDNFFELGGHSLLATRVISRMRQRFGIEVPLRALFEVPTVAGLVEAMDSDRFKVIEKDELDDLQPSNSLDFEDQLAELEAMSDEEAEAALERESILD